MTAPRLHDSDGWRIDRLESQVRDLERKLRDAEYRFESEIESDKNNLQLLVFALASIAIIVVSILSRR